MGGARVLPVLAAILLAVLPASASLSVSPVTFEVTRAAGGSETGVWTIRNNAAETVVVSASALSYRDYITGRRTAPPPAWLDLSPPETVLPPGASATILTRVTVPDSASGELMAMVFFSESPLSGAAMLQGRIGVAVYAMAAGTLDPRLSLVSLRTMQDGDRRQRFLLELANPGNVHVRPRGSFVILDADSRPVDTARLEIGMPVLPGGRERFSSAPTPTRLSAGRYTARWILETGSVDGRDGPALSGEMPFSVE